MKTRETGFTMIELIIVIIILGVLAATALPKFIDMRADAENAAVQGVAGSAAAAMNLNYGGCAFKSQAPSAGYCVTVKNCTDVSGLMQGGVPLGYTVAPNVVGVDIGTSNGNTATCSVSKTVGTATYWATFTGVSAGN